MTQVLGARRRLGAVSSPSLRELGCGGGSLKSPGAVLSGPDLSDTDQLCVRARRPGLHLLAVKRGERAPHRGQRPGAPGTPRVAPHTQQPRGRTAWGGGGRGRCPEARSCLWPRARAVDEAGGRASLHPCWSPGALKSDPAVRGSPVPALGGERIALLAHEFGRLGHSGLPRGHLKG